MLILMVMHVTAVRLIGGRGEGGSKFY